MTLVDRTDHNKLAELARQRASTIADRYIPAADRQVEPSDNELPQDDGRQLASAREAMTELNGFLTENPVIQTHDQARAAGGTVERTRIALSSLAEEMKDKTTPIRAKLDEIYAAYRVVREPLEKVLVECKRRLTAYTTAEEAKRKAAAAAARREAEEAAERAQRAIAEAEDAIAAADVGECNNAGEAIADAYAAMRQAGVAERTAARTERQTTERLGSVMGGRSISMRWVEVLAVIDACAAVKAMGLTPSIAEAILTSARAFKKAHGELPPGITFTKERKI
jgi:hypothetical protein